MAALTSNPRLRNRRPATSAAAMLLLLGLSLPTVHAQESGPVLTAQDLAHSSLPTDNEADLLLPQLVAAIANEDADNTIRLLTALQPYAQSLTAADGGLYYRPVGEVMANTLAKATPRVRDMYRRLYDPAIEVTLESLSGSNDVESLAELFARHPLSEHWPEIGQMLVEQYLELGRYAEAASVADRLLRALPRTPPQVRLQRIAALARLGAVSTAERELDANLKRDDAYHAVSEWLLNLDDPFQTPERSRDVVLSPDEPWVTTMPPWPEQRLKPAEFLAQRAHRQREYLQLRPLVAGNRIVIRRGPQLLAFARDTLLPVWTSTDEDLIRRLHNNTSRQHRMPMPTYEPEDLLLENGWQRAVSADDERIYALDGFSGNRGRRFHNEVRAVGALNIVARYLSDGRVAWKLPKAGGEEDSPVYLTAPQPIEDSLVVLTQRGAEIGLALLEPTSGTLQSELMVLGPPTFPNITGGQYFLAVSGRDVFVISGNGVVAALTLRSKAALKPELHWRWAAVYASELVSPAVQRFTRRTVSRLRPGMPPAVFEDLLVVAPIDADVLIGLDRLSGRKRWETPRRQDDLLVGASSAGVIICGERVHCVSAEDGQSLIWQAVPLPISGVPQLVDAQIFVPTLDGLCVLNADTGRVVADQWLPEPTLGETYPPLGVVAADGNDILLATADRVIRYATPDKRSAEDPNAASQAAENDTATDVDPQTLYAAACRAAATNQTERAFNLLAGVVGETSPLGQAARELRIRLALDLAKRQPEQRTEWLETVTRQDQLATGSAQVQLALARAYAENEQWDEAFTAALQVLTHGEDMQVDVDGEPEATVAAWLSATKLLAELWSTLPSDQVEQQVAKLTETAINAEQPMRLMRLMDALPHQMASPAARQALTLWGTRPLVDFGRSPLHPEQLMDYLAADDADLPGETRWRLALRRLDCYTSLGLRDQADQERALLNTLETSQSYVPSRADQRALRRTEIALGEMSSDATAPPIAPSMTRRWRNAQMQLLQGYRLTSMPPAMIALRLDDDPNALKTLRLLPGDWRESSRGFVASNTQVNAIDDFGRTNRDVGRLANNVVYTDRQAVIPVPGGLVSIGIAPYHQGGKRLWSTNDDELSDAMQVGLAALSKGVLALVSDASQLIGVDLHDGQLRWTRPLQPRAQGVFASNTIISVYSTGHPLRFYRASDGQPITPPNPLPERVQASRATPSTQLIWGEEQFIGLEDGTLVERYRVACPTPKQILFVAGRPWIATQSFTGQWDIHDIETGAAISLTGKFVGGDVSALTADEQRLYIARDSFDDASNRPKLILQSLTLTPEATSWERELIGAASLHSSALSASATWIPVFMLRREKIGDNERNVPDIVFVNKLTGDVSELNNTTNRLLREDDIFEPEPKETILLATANRVILQTDETLIGFGAPNPTTETEPSPDTNSNPETNASAETKPSSESSPSPE